MNAPFYDMAIFLAASDQGTLGVDLFGGKWGNTDSQVLVLDGVAEPTELKEQNEPVGFQLLSRGEPNESPNGAYTRLKTVVDFLLSSPERLTMNAQEYLGFEPTSSIIALGMDDNQRHIYSVNLSSYREGFA